MFRAGVGVVAKLLHFAVNLLRCDFAEAAVARDVAGEENVLLAFAVVHHAELFAHAPFADHLACNPGRLTNVAACAVGDVAENQILRDTTAHDHHEAIQQFVFAVGVFVLGRQIHRRAKRWSARDDSHLVQRVCVLHQAA